VLRVVWQAENGVINAVRESESDVALALLESWAVLLPSRMEFWCSTMVIGVLSRRDLVRMAVHTLEVVWLSSAELVRFQTPTRADFTGKDKRARR